jgi:hypothetical protein
MTSRPLLILIAGPYRSGTGDDQDKMAANLTALEAATWPIFAAAGADQDVAIAGTLGLPVYHRVQDIPVLDQVGDPT